MKWRGGEVSEWKKWMNEWMNEYSFQLFELKRKEKEYWANKEGKEGKQKNKWYFKGMMNFIFLLNISFFIKT